MFKVPGARRTIMAAALIGASGCASVSTLPYATNPDTVAAIKAQGTSPVKVGEFVMAVKFLSMCRAAADITPPVNMTFEGYVATALTNELKWAGRYDDASRVTLTGTVERLAFSSTDAVMGGSWDIAVRVTSTNGASTLVAEKYTFESGFVGGTACKRTAEAFMPAVQSLVQKLVKSDAFASLVKM